tara:strand:+ start:1686 stop:9761 length:8076 start_codon:yes stop_codon:yes gene_type:complete
MVFGFDFKKPSSKYTYRYLKDNKKEEEESLPTKPSALPAPQVTYTGTPIYTKANPVPPIHQSSWIDKYIPPKPLPPSKSLPKPTITWTAPGKTTTNIVDDQVTEMLSRSNPPPVHRLPSHRLSNRAIDESSEAAPSWWTDLYPTRDFSSEPGGYIPTPEVVDYQPGYGKVIRRGEKQRTLYEAGPTNWLGEGGVFDRMGESMARNWEKTKEDINRPIGVNVKQDLVDNFKYIMKDGDYHWVTDKYGIKQTPSRGEKHWAMVEEMRLDLEAEKAHYEELKQFDENPESYDRYKGLEKIDARTGIPNLAKPEEYSGTTLDELNAKLDLFGMAAVPEYIEVEPSLPEVMKRGVGKAIGGAFSLIARRSPEIIGSADWRKHLTNPVEEDVINDAGVFDSFQRTEVPPDAVGIYKYGEDALPLTDKIPEEGWVDSNNKRISAYYTLPEALQLKGYAPEFIAETIERTTLLYDNPFKGSNNQHLRLEAAVKVHDMGLSWHEALDGIPDAISVYTEPTDMYWLQPPEVKEEMIKANPVLNNQWVKRDRELREETERESIIIDADVVGGKVFQHTDTPLSDEKIRDIILEEFDTKGLAGSIDIWDQIWYEVVVDPLNVIGPGIAKVARTRQLTRAAVRHTELFTPLKSVRHVSNNVANLDNVINPVGKGLVKNQGKANQLGMQTIDDLESVTLHEVKVQVNRYETGSGKLKLEKTVDSDLPLVKVDNEWVANPNYKQPRGPIDPLTGKSYQQVREEAAQKLGATVVSPEAVKVKRTPTQKAVDLINPGRFTPQAIVDDIVEAAGDVMSQVQHHATQNAGKINPLTSKTYPTTEETLEVLIRSGQPKPKRTDFPNISDAAWDSKMDQWYVRRLTAEHELAFLPAASSRAGVVTRRLLWETLGDASGRINLPMLTKMLTHGGKPSKVIISLHQKMQSTVESMLLPGRKGHKTIDSWIAAGNKANEYPVFSRGETGAIERLKITERINVIGKQQQVQTIEDITQLAAPVPKATGIGHFAYLSGDNAPSWGRQLQAQTLGNWGLLRRVMNNTLWYGYGRLNPAYSARNFYNNLITAIVDGNYTIQNNNVLNNFHELLPMPVVAEKGIGGGARGSEIYHTSTFDGFAGTGTVRIGDQDIAFASQAAEQKMAKNVTANSMLKTLNDKLVLDVGIIPLETVAPALHAKLLAAGGEGLVNRFYRNISFIADADGNLTSILNVEEAVKILKRDVLRPQLMADEILTPAIEKAFKSLGDQNTTLMKLRKILEGDDIVVIRTQLADLRDDLLEQITNARKKTPILPDPDDTLRFKSLQELIDRFNEGKKALSKTDLDALIGITDEELRISAWTQSEHHTQINAAQNMKNRVHGRDLSDEKVKALTADVDSFTDVASKGYKTVISETDRLAKDAWAKHQSLSKVAEGDALTLARHELWQEYYISRDVMWTSLIDEQNAAFDVLQNKWYGKNSPAINAKGENVISPIKQLELVFDPAEIRTIKHVFDTPGTGLIDQATNRTFIGSTKAPLTSDDLLHLADYAKQQKQRAAELQTIAAQKAKFDRDFTLLKYGDRRSIDTWLSHVYPFHYWYTRTYNNWLKRVALHPRMVSNYAKTRELRQDMHAALPDYWQQRLSSADMGLDLDNPMYFHAEAGMSPVHGATGTDFVDPEKHSAKFLGMKGQTVEGLGSGGPAIGAYWIWALAAGEAKKGNHTGAAAWLGQTAPIFTAGKTATGHLQAVGEKMGIPLLADKLPVGGLNVDPQVAVSHALRHGNWNPFEMYGIATTKWDDRKRTAAALDIYNNWTPELASQIPALNTPEALESLNADPERKNQEWRMVVMEGIRDKTGPIWDEIVRRTFHATSLQTWGQLLAGLSVRGTPTGQDELHELFKGKNVIRELYDEGASDDEIAQAQIELYQKHPEIKVIDEFRMSPSERANSIINQALNNPNVPSSSIMGLINKETSSDWYSTRDVDRMTPEHATDLLAAAKDINETILPGTTEQAVEQSEVRGKYKKLEAEIEAELGSELYKDVLQENRRWQKIITESGDAAGEGFLQLLADNNPELYEARLNYYHMLDTKIVDDVELLFHYRDDKFFEEYYTEHKFTKVWEEKHPTTTFEIAGETYNASFEEVMAMWENRSTTPHADRQAYTDRLKRIIPWLDEYLDANNRWETVDAPILYNELREKMLAAGTGVLPGPAVRISRQPGTLDPGEKTDEVELLVEDQYTQDSPWPTMPVVEPSALDMQQAVLQELESEETSTDRYGEQWREFVLEPIINHESIGGSHIAWTTWKQAEMLFRFPEPSAKGVDGLLAYVQNSNGRTLREAMYEETIDNGFDRNLVAHTVMGTIQALSPYDLNALASQHPELKDIREIFWALYGEPALTFEVFEHALGEKANINADGSISTSQYRPKGLSAMDIFKAENIEGSLVTDENDRYISTADVHEYVRRLAQEKLGTDMYLRVEEARRVALSDPIAYQQILENEPRIKAFIGLSDEIFDRFKITKETPGNKKWVKFFEELASGSRSSDIDGLIKMVSDPEYTGDRPSTSTSTKTKKPIGRLVSRKIPKQYRPYDSVYTSAMSAFLQPQAPKQRRATTRQGEPQLQPPPMDLTPWTSILTKWTQDKNPILVPLMDYFDLSPYAKQAHLQRNPNLARWLSTLPAEQLALMEKAYYVWAQQTGRITPRQERRIQTSRPNLATTLRVYKPRGVRAGL